MKTTKVVGNLLGDELVRRLLAGQFPQVEYKVEGGMVRFNLFERVTVFGKLASLVDTRMNERGLEGIFSRKRSAAFLSAMKEEAGKVTEAEVMATPRKFRSMFD